MNFRSTNFWECPRIYRAALLILVAISACDELQIGGKPRVSIGTIHDITLYANSEAIIPIQASIASNISLKIECDSKPKLGYVEATLEGDFKFTPYMNVIGTDEMTFTFKDNTTDVEVAQPYTLKVNIREYTNTLSCQSVAVSDLVAGNRLLQNSFFIEPIANDTICFDEYSLSIYHPSASFMPHRGKATVIAGSSDSDHKPVINYQWEGPTILEDTIMYKIIDKKDPGNVTYGLILIASGECQSTLRDDFETVLEDGSLTVDLLANDDLCSPVTSASSITLQQLPRHGTIEQKVSGGEWSEVAFPGEFIYHARSSGTWSSDTVIYQYCDRICSTARLVISASH